MNIGLIGVGAVLALAAMGSAIGAGVAGMSAIGAWKKAFAQNRPAPFLLIAFVGAPLTQTIYGYIVMNSALLPKVGGTTDPGMLLGIGVFGGLALGTSAWFQGRAAASACDALTETGKGFANYLFVLGIIETTALFVMAFVLSIAGGI